MRLNQMEVVQSTYLTCIKSLVTNVERLCTEIDQNDLPITDDSMIESFRTMSKTLQRILSKRDKVKPQPKEESKKSLSNPLATLESKSMEGGLFDESFLYKGPEDTEIIAPPMDVVHTGEITSTTVRDDVADRIRKRMKKDIEDSDEEMGYPRTTLDSILNPPRTTLNSILDPPKVQSSEKVDILAEHPEIKKIDNDIYECLSCNRQMNRNNIPSHVKGKTHNKASRDNSLCGDRKSSATKMEDDIKRILETVPKNLTQNGVGDVYISVGNPINQYYYCSLCKVDIARSEKNLQEHVNGHAHKRLCSRS